MKKLLFVAILMLALVFTVVACNNNKNPDDTTAGETTVVVDPGTAADPETEPDATEPDVTEPVTAAPVETTQASDTTAEPPTTAPVVTTEPATTEAPVDPSEPVWIIDAAALAEKAATGNVMAAELQDGYVRLTSTGDDPYFQFASGLGTMPQYLAFAYRTNTALKGQIFIGSGAGPSGAGDNPLVDWNEDGNWNLLVVDLTAIDGLTSITDGNINYVRLDFFTDAGAEGDYFDLEFVAFFNSPEYAQAYHFEQHKAPAWGESGFVTHVSFDELDKYAGTTKIEGVFTPGQSAGWDGIVNLPDFSVDTLRFWGWTAATGELGQFGYQINGGTPIYDDAWTYPEDMLVHAPAGSTHATRMAILIPLAGLEGENNVRALYKNAEGKEACIGEFTVILPEKPKDIKNTFASDISSVAAGTALGSTDLANFFTPMLNLGNYLSVDGAYVIDGISELYADVNGKYALSVNFPAGSSGDYAAIVRGVHAVNSTQGDMKINNFYETDGSYFGGAGIYATISGGTLKITVKTFDASITTCVKNVTYRLDCDGENLTMADDGETVYIMVDGVLYATIALSGEVEYPVENLNNIQPQTTFAKTAVVTLRNGTVETLTDTLVDSTCDTQIAIAIRGGSYNFNYVKVDAFSAIEIPEMEIEQPRENIALNKPVSSDSIENETNIPSNATDGDEATRYGALQSGEAKLTVDLEAVYALSDMKVLFENASCEYEIAISVDGVNYTQIHTSTGHGASTVNLKDLNGAEARYILFHRMPTDTPSSWFSIYELYVYGELSDNQPEEPMTPEEIVNAAYALEPGAALEGTYTLTGVITSIDTPYSNQYGNITVTIQVGDMADKPIQCFRLKGEGAADLKVTDTITVTGTLKNYNGTIEFDTGCTLDAVVPGEGPVEPTYTTPEEIVNAAYALEVGASLSKEYTLTGVITSVDTKYDENYKNVTVTMVVGDMTDKPIQCFRLKGEGADVISVGDTITVTGVLTNYNGKIEFNSGCILNSYEPAPIPEPVPGSEELPLVWEGDVEVAGTHDVWYTYTAAEDGILVITYPAGNWISGLANKTDAAYSINVTKGQTVTFNIFGNNEGTYSAKMVKFIDATPEGLFVDEAEVAVDTSVLFLDKGAFAALIHTGSVEIVGDSIQFVYNVNGVVSDPIEAIEATAYSITVPADALKLGGNLIKIGVVIDGLTVEYFWEYTVVVETTEETETAEPETETQEPETEEPAPVLTPEEIVDAAYALAEGETLEGTYTLTGVITSIDTPYSSQYDNITVTIQVGDMADKLIQCFRLAGEGAADLKVGDTITVTGTLTNYYGKIEYKQGCNLDAVIPGEEPEPEIPDASAITLEFVVDNRTEFSTEKQVYATGALSVTNDKGASTNDIADYSAPARFYKNSTLTVACTGMNKIEFVCNAAKYATALAEAITGDNLTVETDGTTIIVTFTASVDSYTVQLTGGQVRLNSVAVYVA